MGVGGSWSHPGKTHWRRQEAWIRALRILYSAEGTGQPLQPLCKWSKGSLRSETQVLLPVSGAVTSSWLRAGKWNRSGKILRSIWDKVTESEASRDIGEPF